MFSMVYPDYVVRSRQTSHTDRPAITRWCSTPERLVMLSWEVHLYALHRRKGSDIAMMSRSWLAWVVERS